MDFNRVEKWREEGMRRETWKGKWGLTRQEMPGLHQSHLFTPAHLLFMIAKKQKWANSGASPYYSF
jgi:hypothetical protein